jgi:hypothetical protein
MAYAQKLRSYFCCPRELWTTFAGLCDAIYALRVLVEKSLTG